jgi:hypothetical protein
MRSELRIPDTTNTRLHGRDYDAELDDFRSILRDICRAIDGHGQFLVSGFGEDHWPVDVRTDLVVFLEQLPCVIDAISAGRPSEIDFYEQGVERKIVLSPTGDSYLATCISLGAWQPLAEIETLERKSLKLMLISVRDTFMTLVRGFSPKLANDERLREWLECEQTT